MNKILCYVILTICVNFAMGQTSSQNKITTNENFPAPAVWMNDVVYNTDLNHKLKLDIYFPDDKRTDFPVLILIHGGAWYEGNKYGDVLGIKNTVKKILQEGIAVVSIDYRLSGEAIFPAQIQDCNEAISFIWKNSKQLRLDKNKIGVIGFSAGGHLATLIGTSNSHKITEFYKDKKKPSFAIKAVVDFFGPTDFIAMRGNSGAVDHDAVNSAEARLLGFPPLDRPDLAKWVSPTSYVDKKCPPFLIIQGKKDPIVQFSQSILLNSYLKLAGVQSELIGIQEAGHGGPMFDTDEIGLKVVDFLKQKLK